MGPLPSDAVDAALSSSSLRTRHSSGSESQRGHRTRPLRFSSFGAYVGFMCHHYVRRTMEPDCEAAQVRFDDRGSTTLGCPGGHSELVRFKFALLAFSAEDPGSLHSLRASIFHPAQPPRARST
jgi:hypothetical protein